METNENKKKEMAYYPSLFAFLPLPYSKVNDKIFTRKYKNYDLAFFGINGIPYAKYPRQLLSLITTQYILQHKDYTDEKQARTIILSDIQTVAKGLGIKGNLTGGVQGNGTRLSKSMIQLGGLMLSTQSIEVTNTYKCLRQENISLFNEVEIYWTFSDKRNMLVPQKELFTSSIVISKDFSEILIGHSVPIDVYIYNNLENARQQDLYVWARRRIKNIEEETKIKIDDLLPQFFDKVTIKNKSEKKEMLKENLFEVLKADKEIKIKSDGNNLVLIPSLLRIEKNNEGYC